MKRVWWDAGHGGRDSGAVGGGLKEKDLVLRIVLEADMFLKENYEDIETNFTRTTDTFIELEQRATLASNWKSDVFVSVHINSGGGKGGFETFIYNNKVTDANIKLQSLLHTEIMNTINKYREVPDRGMKRKDLAVLRGSTNKGVPSCLTETLFISVTDDVQLLKQDKFITDVAHAHARGVAKFLNLKEKKPSALVYVNNKLLGNDAFIKNGRVYSPIRSVAEALDAKVGYDAKAKRPLINNEVVKDSININGTTYAPVRTVCDLLGVKFDWHNDTKKLKIWS